MGNCGVSSGEHNADGTVACQTVSLGAQIDMNSTGNWSCDHSGCTGQRTCLSVDPMQSHYEATYSLRVGKGRNVKAPQHSDPTKSISSCL